MSFHDLIGNDRIKNYLTHMVNQGAIGNSLLFAGPQGIGKSLFAIELAKMLIGSKKINAHSHPDLHIYRPTGKLGLHTIDSMRQLIEEVYMPAYEASWKIFIVHDAERMLPYSSNALLKTLEEPLADTLIILLSSSPRSLLPTILSRCRTLYFNPISVQEMIPFLVAHYHKNEEEARVLASQAQGSLARALLLVKDGGDPRKGPLLEVLSRNNFNSYSDLQRFAAYLQELTDQRNQHVEVLAQKELFEGFSEDSLTAAQREVIEKEVEGLVALRNLAEVEALFEMILGWYRDIHLLHVNGNSEYLIYPECKEALEERLQRGGIPLLEEVQGYLAEAKLAVERSLGLHTALETLFLKLHFL